MKILFHSKNHGYTRPQWLVIIVLALIAFECGFHYAEKRFQEAKKADAKRLAAIKTTPPSYPQESLSADETNVAAFQPVRRPQPLSEKTNPIVRPPAPSGGGGGGMPEILKGDGPITRRKIPSPQDNYLRGTNGQIIGIRIALP